MYIPTYVCIVFQEIVNIYLYGKAKMYYFNFLYNYYKLL